jgi:hypothetical protein
MVLGVDDLLKSIAFYENGFVPPYFEHLMENVTLPKFTPNSVRWIDPENDSA